ncbi:MAG: DUF1016 N-terminal domain-containing protein [Planctomycetota bacterium]|nr:DUF1016 N-terminal domain-containing protein [Planctomycetota bacterium]
MVRAPLETAFTEVLQLIQAAKQRAYQAVNSELVALYWQVGEYISRKLESSEWGDKVVNDLARYLARTQPGLRGFTRPNLFRMRQFYNAYRDEPIVSALLRQLPWTHHLAILSRSKMAEEREFYVRLAIREKWSSRELERQLQTARFERTILNPISETKRLPIFLPPPDAQTAIVRFLDHANRKIDGFIRAKRKLIGLLNEQKQAIILRAVTRGLHHAENHPQISADFPEIHLRKSAKSADKNLKISGIPWPEKSPRGWMPRFNEILRRAPLLLDGWQRVGYKQSVPDSWENPARAAGLP